MECEYAMRHPDVDYTSIVRAISLTVTKRDFQALHGLEIMDNLVIFEPLLPDKLSPDSPPARYLVLSDSTSDITSREFLQLFGNLPLLEFVSARGDRVVNPSIQGLKIRSPQVNLDDEYVLFPGLKEITLRNTPTYVPMLEELYDNLVSRYETTWRLRKLCLRNCPTNCSVDQFR
ncbi:hypothetical protein D9619_010073 [Psilocybe cf. subviscida]|uniref:Uncharacterized protein n=1 Tax=Psilocybe cf. subviscida TaxID=2480587 RepID=A0A8H5F6M3_9AGAR|nr:hypothetical protein D9619_010073 [Psilocybe cf. subviscida]